MYDLLYLGHAVCHCFVTVVCFVRAPYHVIKVLSDIK